MKSALDDHPLIFVLLGARGDLARRLILPALFSLYKADELPREFVLLGVGHGEGGDQEFADYCRACVCDENAAEQSPSQGAWQPFAETLHYLRADLDDANSYARLKQALDERARAGLQPADHVFYMATPPSLFARIARGVAAAGLAEPRERTRIVAEKPLGHDLESFREINTALTEGFAESQIFRIDHFLGKETVQNILALRFANPIFEPVWNRRYVDHVVVTVAETLGVESRAGYYEHAGALRDMVQNHLLQLLCLVAMEPPVAYAAEDIRNKKMDVLHAVRPILREVVAECAARGQYAAGWLAGRQVPGYREDSGIDPHSNTETYAAIRLHIDNWRWQDVPFYLRTGKRMAAAVSEISIRFRDVPHHSFPAAMGLNAQPTRLVIQIQPEEGIVLKFMAKEPGYQLHLRPVDMSFRYRDTFNKPSPEAYETLLWDVMHGDASLFMRADQVEAAWQILQPVLDVWQNERAFDFPNYPAGSWGPESAELLVARDGRSWLTPTLPQVCG